MALKTETPQQRGKRARRTGNRFENDVRKMHEKIGIFAERVPLSGQIGYRGNDADLDVYAFGKEEPPLVFECKKRGQGQGFALIERWLGDHDGLMLGRNRAQPLVVLTWDAWERLLAG